ncbi:hypothetical protein TRFO_07736 [Tritrichomonas foetus]|uniref:Uncharacterized protein n=1 Tax=Tritrichomonas foetus TaxID=1144522 RepID=A0A1J4JNR5_9EUKA|nr:hypothetical protein TRFO_07736 [Tritrichomonas foetus]|eukprot:OHT00769.1 hypothetical protein TRFO_07736 [Tritrichomonas foetus]
MNSFLELMNDMQYDMHDQQKKIDSYARIMFQWLDRVSYDIDPNSIPSEFSSYPDTEEFFSYESITASSVLAQDIGDQFSIISNDFENSFTSENESFKLLPPNKKSSLKRGSNENSILKTPIRIDSSKKVLFTGNEPRTREEPIKETPTKKNKPFYFGMSEHVDELANDADKFRKKWLDSISKNLPQEM